jgi:PEGA domain-containing protein
VGLCAALGGAAWAALRPRPEPVPSLVEKPKRPPATQQAPTGEARPREAAPTLTPAIEEEERFTGTTRAKPPKREYALLTVASEPWGTVYLGNKEIGPTPIADYPLAEGTYRLRIEQEGYRAKVETIVISGPNPIRRRYILEPAGLP